jgi:hypothetical protein
LKYSKYLEDALHEEIMDDPSWPSIADHWRIMGYYVDHHNQMICSMHPEYKTIPKTSMAEDIAEAKFPKKPVNKDIEMKRKALLERIAELEKQAAMGKIDASANKAVVAQMEELDMY